MKLKEFSKELKQLCDKHGVIIFSPYVDIREAKDYAGYTMTAAKSRMEYMGGITLKETKGNFIITNPPKIKQEKVVPVESHFYRQSFQEFISPIDGKAISSTSQLRDHERQYGVKQVGNDLITKKEQQ